MQPKDFLPKKLVFGNMIYGVIQEMTGKQCIIAMHSDIEQSHRATLRSHLSNS